ncbi:MAG: helix-turn-helix domain-containing protein [Gaiellaceae bacterium MAG52_C11]|nr:helix-turn-helix domain-containing protein [Candidatus Gaiellasilicea maunaloa]
MFEIGNSLREARLRQQLELPQAEHGTKIRVKYLRALEEDRFEVLPSHTYVKGFLRSYADYLGLDGQLYVDEYNSRFVVGDEDLPPRTRRVPADRRRRHDRRESKVVLLALVSIGVLTALVIAAWRFGGAEPQDVRGLQPAQTTQRGAPAPAPTGTARVEVIATKGDSFVVARRGSAIGLAEYSGTVERGQKQRFVGKLLWLQVRSPQNVIVRLNGNRVKLPAATRTRGVFVTSKRVFVADPS